MVRKKPQKSKILAVPRVSSLEHIMQYSALYVYSKSYHDCIEIMDTHSSNTQTGVIGC